MLLPGASPEKGRGEKLGVYDVPATMLINEIAKEFREQNIIQEPEFTKFVKTGAHRERAPLREDWWYVRSAALLYRIFRDGPVGTERLRTYYGGKRNRGVKPEKFKKASGKVIRACLQGLEAAGYVKKAKKGRAITPKGQSYLNTISKKLAPSWNEQVKKAKEVKTRAYAPAQKLPVNEIKTENREKVQMQPKGKPEVKTEMIKTPEVKTEVKQNTEPKPVKEETQAKPTEATEKK